MSGAANALQKAVYERLTGYAPLTALVGDRVYDHVPQDTPAPYVVIGDMTAVDWSTKTETGREFTVTVHAWDFERAGRKSVNDILGALSDALDRRESSLTLTGYALVEIRFDNEIPAFPEPGVEGAADHYYHGLTRFRALVQAT